MRKFIIFANESKSMFVTSIAVSSNDITRGILTDPLVADFYEKFYGKDKRYEILYLDTEEGKEFIQNLRDEAQVKYNEAEREMKKQREFINKLFILT